MTEIRRLRVVALLEGASFLVLLFVAMPLKYWLGFPLAVRVVGLAHGVLFLGFMVVLFRAALERGWTLSRWLLGFVAALLPFGTFVFDRSLKRELSSLSPE